MNKLSLGRYNENNNNEGSSLHKGLLLEEAKQFGFRGLQNATKEELNALVNGEVKTEEESQLLYKKIKQDIKERMSKKKVVETKIDIVDEPKIDIIDEPKLIVSTNKDNKDFQLKPIIDENGVMHIAKVYKINDNESFLTW
jgi:hypothetical protein